MTTAQHVLDTYWDGTLPVDVGRLANAMGIEVRNDPYLLESGMVEVTPDGRAIITVNSMEYGPRQRFTIAHEIGHIALGHLNHSQTLFRDDASNFTTGTYLPLERQSNQFAAELLMPAKVVSFAISERGYTTLESLASLFGVSEVAMKWRLHNLGIV